MKVLNLHTMTWKEKKAQLPTWHEIEAILGKRSFRLHGDGYIEFDEELTPAEKAAIENLINAKEV